MSFFGLLGVLFIALKLTHVIDWSWYLVLLPIYGSIAIGTLVILFLAVLSAMSR